ncbi:MAG: hypothetical protein HY675_15050 [Chloroflexi bacterium]|nr:hypothetical protein [Chloroflexota bacterium]
MPLLDFCRRTGLERDAVENLISVGAFDGLGIPRRQLLWQLPETLRLVGSVRPVGAVREPPLPMTSTSDVDLPAMSIQEQASADYFILGLSPNTHVMEFYRSRLDGLRVVPIDELECTHDGVLVRVAGLVACRQRPGTAKGFVFITLEDETGLANIIVNPQVYEEYRPIVRGELLVIIEGTLQKQNGVTNISARRCFKMPRLRAQEQHTLPRSRDFH